MSTNKEVLFKGVKYIAWALPLYFMGPSIIYNAFVNKGNPWHYLVLAFGMVACFFAIFFTFRGLKTIMQSLFDGNK